MEASGSVASDLSAYCQNIPYGDELASVDDKIRWWNDRATIYPKLSPLAADILAAPASEAYVQRIFSVTGDLSTGKKNRAEKSLEKKVFLKLNKKLWKSCKSDSD